MFRWGFTFRPIYSEDDKPPTDLKKRISVRCPVCGVHTDAAIVGLVVTPASQFVQLPDSSWSVYNYLVQCTRCKSGLLIMWSYGEHITQKYTAGRLVYPLPTSPFETEKMAEGAVPAAVLEDLRQAELAHLSGAPYGAGLLLRRAAQYICREQQVPETGGLANQIKALATRGVITRHLAEIADAVRILGNELAHPDVNTPSIISSEDVRLAWEFMCQLVRAIYIDPVRVKEFKEKLRDREG